MPVFFSKDDYRSYAAILARQAKAHALEIWAYCLMPNHVHLVVVPSTETGLSRPIGEAHRRYARLINRQHGWTGHLWQERFASFPMDETHLLAAVRYVLLNPVRAGLAATSTDWPHSSARAHIHRAPDKLINRHPMAKRISNWDSYLSHIEFEAETCSLRRRGQIGRPLGSARFIEELETATGRHLRPRVAGRKPKEK